MKKKSTASVFLIFILAGFGFLTASAQGGESHFKDVRIFGGVNLGSVSTESNRFELIDSVLHRRDIKGQLGVQFGASFTFGNHLYISPGIWYSTYTAKTYLLEQEGQKDKDNKNDFEKETTISTVSIPVRLGFRLVNPESVKVINARIYGGVTGSQVLSVNHKGDDQIDLTEDDFENMFVSATAGVGVDVLFFFIDGGYDIGLTNYEKSGSKSRHNSFFVNLGIKFHL